MSEITDDGEAKIVWPIPDFLSYRDAAETLFEIGAAKLDITDYDVAGNEHVDDLYVQLFSMGDDDGYVFHRAKLIDLLEDSDSYEDRECYYTFNNEIPDIQTDEQAAKHHRTSRLFIRLIRAYREWKATDANYSPDELRANPLEPLASGATETTGEVEDGHA